MSLFAKVSSESSNYSPLKPGLAIPVTLQKAELSKINEKTGKGTVGNLVVYFKGSSVDNAGSSGFTFRLSTFDESAPSYNPSVAENAIRKIKCIVEAFCTLAEADKLNNVSSIKEGFDVVIELLSDKVGQPALLTVVYQKDSDEYVDLPNYGDFISSELSPRGLVLNLKPNEKNNNLPYDRIKPLAEYGIVAPAANAVPGQAGALPGSFPAAGIPAAAPAPMSRPVPTAAPIATPTSEPAFGAPSVQ